MGTQEYLQNKKISFLHQYVVLRISAIVGGMGRCQKCIVIPHNVSQTRYLYLEGFL